MPTAAHPLLKANRMIMEALVIDAAASAADPVVWFNGSHIVSTLVDLLLTSRGFGDAQVGECEGCAGD